MEQILQPMPAPEPIPDLLKAVNAASGKAFALWITFLSVGTYLAIAIGTTTDLQLLLAGPVKLPLLGVDLPLFAFYGFAPPLFVVLHLYVLMQLYLLARLLRLFDDDLRGADMIEQDRRRVRGQLDKFVFTQALIGAPEDWIVRALLRAVVLLSFVVGPVLLLLGFELRFLGYYSTLVTNVQLVTLLFDLVLLLLLWPKITGTTMQQVQASRTRLWRVAFAYGVRSVGVGAILYIGVGGSIIRPSQYGLDLRNQRLVEPDEEKLSKLAVSLSLRGRDLPFGAFSGSDFRKADLSGANLIDADLSRANLSRANLNDAKLIHADLRDADLHGANLGGAVLSGADLSGANLSDANLGGADLLRTDLSGADLSGAVLSGADLGSAGLPNPPNLSRADLREARGVTQTQLDRACGTDAKLPEGLTLRPCPPDWRRWPPEVP
jgi:uncharacterized protein YjbI with pentapeptide repeats